MFRRALQPVQQATCPPPSLMLPSVLASQGLPIDANKSIQKATRDVLKDNTRKSLVAK